MWMRQIRQAEPLAGPKIRCSTMQYPKPKILLMDAPYDCFKTLEQDGFNVARGSFGVVYPLSGDGYEPVTSTAKVPENYAEQDIVVVDMVHRFDHIERRNPFLNADEEGLFYRSAR